MKKLNQKLSHRLCPDCRSQFLYITHYDQAEVDYCLKCKGIWFEAGEVSSVQYDKPTDDNCREFENNLGKFVEISDIQCPDCRVPLNKHYLIDGYNVDVDCCHRCSGVWVEQHELEEVAHAPKLKEAIDAAQEKTTWKTWIFQFLSQLPVEFNVKARITPWVTYSLMAINILIFLFMMVSPSIATFMMESWAFVPAKFSEIEGAFSLIGHQFLHGGLVHLIGNMYFLYVIGDNLEDALGRTQFLALYILCGLVAVFFQFISEPGSTIPMVGASGAISGLFGMYLIWFKHARLSFMLVVFQFKLSPAIYFSIWVIINVLGMVSGNEGVAYWAHLGGFIAGLALGWLLKSYVLKHNLTLSMLHSENMNV